MLLLDMVHTGRSARDVGPTPGGAWPQTYPAPPTPSTGSINAARQGFDPRRATTRASTDLILGRCPFQAAGGAVEVADLIAPETRKADRRLCCSVNRGGSRRPWPARSPHR